MVHVSMRPGLSVIAWLETEIVPDCSLHCKQTGKSHRSLILAHAQVLLYWLDTSDKYNMSESSKTIE